MEDLTSNKRGPKFKFNDPEELQSKIDEYFKSLEGSFKKTISDRQGNKKTIECDKPATIEG